MSLNREKGLMHNTKVFGVEIQKQISVVGGDKRFNEK
jgi:hypothetical protein